MEVEVERGGGKSRRREGDVSEWERKEGVKERGEEGGEWEKGKKWG